LNSARASVLVLLARSAGLAGGHEQIKIDKPTANGATAVASLYLVLDLGSGLLSDLLLDLVLDRATPLLTVISVLGSALNKKFDASYIYPKSGRLRSH
jgi:hypothetical protein